MKALVGVLVLVIAFVSSGAVSAAPAQADLEWAILTQEEVGGGHTVFQSGPLNEATEAGIANYAVAYVRMPSLLSFAVSGVGVALADAAAAEQTGYTPEALLDQAAGLGLTITPVDSPGIGEESQRYAVSGDLYGFPIQGEAITWKEHGVRAAVVAISTVSSPSALPYAERQSAKLQAVFGG